MAQNPFQTKKFKKLHEQWSKKLERSGFVDEEDSFERLKNSSLNNSGVYQRSAYRQLNHRGIEKQATTWRVSVETYYRLAGNFLHSYRWPNQKDREIWALHSAGEPIPKILESLAKKRIPIAVITVRRRLAHYRRLAGLAHGERKKPQK